MTEASELFGKFQEFWRAGKDARLSMEGDLSRGVVREEGLAVAGTSWQ